MKRIFTFFCALVLFVSCFSGVFVQAAEMDAAQQNIEAVIEPVETVPAETEPAETIPEDTEPAETVPAETAPAETVPAETAPAETVPAETAPAETVPAETVPAETAPAETVPEQPQEPAPAPKSVELEPVQIANLASLTNVPKNYKAPYEKELGANFVNYVQSYISQCQAEIPITQFKISVDAFNDICNLIFYESPELFGPKLIGGSYDPSTGKLTVLRMKEYQPYADTPAEYRQCLQSIRAARDYLVRGVKGNTSLSQLEKALILHDRLAVWNEYDLGIYKYSNYNKPEIYSAVGPLMNQSGVCQGIALAYTYLLKEVGIESDLCLSDALNHAWNIIWIDGVPYHVDVTWDDVTNATSEEFHDDYGRVMHNNFLLSSDGIWNTGHKAFDYNDTPSDTRYDYAGWWRNTETAIQLVASDLIYYRSKNDGHIYRCENGSTWIVSYTDGYKGKLTGMGTDLFYNSKKAVYKLDMTNGNITTVCTPSDIAYGNGYIEGLKYEKGRIYVQLNNGSGYSWRESMEWADTSPAVQIVTQPKTGVFANGATAKATVKAAGDGLIYNWYYAKKGVSYYTLLNNQITETLSFKMTSTWNGAKFYCVVSDIYGNSVTSNVVTLYMGNLAKITAQPTNAAAPNGKTVKLAVKATGDGLKYQWYYAKASATSWTKLGGKTASTLSFKMTSTWNGAKFCCVITDKYGNVVKSGTAKTYMGNPVKITAQPKNTAAVSGKTAKITVKASGSGLKYTWYYAKKGATSWTKSGSAKTNTFTTKMSSALNGCRFYCVITDKYGVSVKTSVVTLTLAKVAKITTQPVNTVSPKNKTVKVSVKATGDGLKYQWYYAKKGSSKFKKLSGKTSATYSVKMTSSVNGRKVYCVVTDKYGNSVKTKTATLTLVDTKKVVAKTWKGTYEYFNDGRKYSISKLSIKITTSGKVTIKVPAAGVGYNKGTFTYKLKYVKCVGDTVYYQFVNNIETLTVTYSATNKNLTLYLGNSCRQVFKKK